MPSNLRSDIATLLVRELRGVQRELELFTDDETVWATLPGVSNSSGNLALHVTGNLRHFVGAVLGNIPYTRDRTAEFDRRSGERVALASEIERAIEAVFATIHALPDGSMDRDYPQATGSTRPLTTRIFMLHLCAHAAYHLGQIGYLRRIVTGQNRPAGSLSLESLT